MGTLETVEKEILRIEAELATAPDDSHRQALQTVLHKMRLSRAALERQAVAPARHVEPGAPQDPYLS